MILALAAALRAWHVGRLIPIMIDETIYLRWAEIIHHQGQFFISLLDGKTPLSFWILALARIIYHGDPLLTARLISVATGTASTWLLFALGHRLAGPIAAYTTAVLYALLPYGLLYDRVAYTDTFVNFCGIQLAYVSVIALARGKPGVRAGIAVGVAMGIAYSFKPTAGLLAAIPAGIAIAGRWRECRKALAIAAVVFVVFPLLWHTVVPSAPMFADTNLLLHRASFFTAPGVIIAAPLTNLPGNLDLLGQYVRAYLTAPFALAAIAACVAAARRKPVAAWLFISGSLVPVAIQMTLLNWFPSRYVFPHVWPCAVAVGAAVACCSDCRGRPATYAAWLGTATVAVALAIQSGNFLTHPARAMQANDAEEHLGSGGFSGAGIAEAVRFLESQAQPEGYTLLTDPIWGPPADAMYPYLNGRLGIQVYDAWWMQLWDSHPILPREPKLVMKSQYERIPDSLVNFPALGRVLYITATNYNQPSQVAAREPGAIHIARFPRPNGMDFVDIYRLR
jgi:4-amino-4-deoxy-L-arabinose transferase-like glycosyltransferase